MQAGGTLVIDVATLAFCDSSGLRALAGPGGSGRAEHPPPPPGPRHASSGGRSGSRAWSACSRSGRDPWKEPEEPPLTSRHGRDPPPPPRRFRAIGPRGHHRGSAASIGKRLAEAAVVVDVDGFCARPRPPARRRYRRRWPSSPRERPRSLRDPPLDRPRDGAGRARPLARRRVRHRPAHRGRLLLRLRAAGRGHVHAGRPASGSRPGCARSSPRSSRSSAASTRQDEALELVRRPAAQARDHRGAEDPMARDGHRSGVDLRQPAARSSTSAAARTSSTQAATSGTSS